MSDGVIDAEFTDQPRAGGRGYGLPMRDQEQRERAYDLWSYEANQSARETCRLMVERHGTTLPYSTLMRWIKDEQWSRRLLAERLEFTPASLREELIANLAESALYGSRYLRDAIRQDPVRDASGAAVRTRSGADGVGDDPSGPVLTRVVPTRELNELAKLALDRYLGKVEGGIVAQLVAEGRSGDVIDLDALSDDELAERAAGQLNRGGS